MTESLFQRLVESAPDAMVVVDESGRILFVNFQIERTFGYERSELVGQPIEILIPERARKTHVGHRTGFFQAPKTRPMGTGMELYGRRKDGSEIPVEISLSPVETDSGRLVSAAIRDITDRKHVQELVRRTNIYLTNAVESFQGAFAIFDVGDRIVLCNSTFRALFARRGLDPIGRMHQEIVEDCLASDQLDFGDEPLGSVRARWLDHHKKPRGSFEIRTKTGRIIRVRDRRTLDGGVVSTTDDITEDVAREHDLEAARSMAEAASAAKSEFLSSMSHELRTPLNAVLGFAQLLERDKKSPLTERQKERLGHVIKGGEHLLRLIDDVLDLSQIEAGRVMISPEAVGVESVLAEVISTLGSMARRAEIRVESTPVPATAAQVLADRTRFSQILMNFGSNSIKYGTNGGSVRFVTTAESGRVRIGVIDDGIGIPVEKQDKIFQPFQRAGQEAGSIEGTGIGLAISKRLATMMGATVGFESTPGKGSHFFVDLPVPEEKAVAAKPPAPRRSSVLTDGAGTRRTVLYVEDNPSNIAFMEAFFTDFEHIELVVAPTAEIGIELARARKPNLVLLDINLPGMSGFDAVKRLKELPETASIPVVALTAAAMAKDARRAEEAGFHHYLTKPVDVDELTSVLEEVLSS